MNRRAFLAVAGGVAVTSPSRAQTPPVSPVPTPRVWTGDPLPYPDPDIVALDPRFNRYVVRNTPIRRLHTGTLWAEGPAWNGVGRYLLWSDIPNDVQLRWLEEDGHVSDASVSRPATATATRSTIKVARSSASMARRRVVRYEPTAADRVADATRASDSTRPTTPSCIPDGDIWFTDPLYGINGNYEGVKSESELPVAVYRVDGRSGQVDKVGDEFGGPNGLCFSPDYKKLYVADTGGPRAIRVFDVDGTALRNGRTFATLQIPGTNAPSGADGLRCDVDGNVWAGARPGVQVLAPTGELLGMIRLPETCANVCFGGARRNRLFMTASQSLYAVYVNTSGAHIA